jgi:hypothetical protein
MEGVVVKMVAMFGVAANGAVVVVVVVVEIEVFLVEVDEAPKRLGPLTAANGDPIPAYARKPPPPWIHVSMPLSLTRSRQRTTHENGRRSRSGRCRRTQRMKIYPRPTLLPRRFFRFFFVFVFLRGWGCTFRFAWVWIQVTILILTRTLRGAIDLRRRGCGPFGLW